MPRDVERSRRPAVVVAGALWSLSALASAADRWVDTSIAADCPDYDVAARACGGGDQTAHATLASADAAAAPGDVVHVRAAEFSAPFVVTTSGSEGAPVVFRRHADEVVRFSGIASDEGAILLDGRAWVEIEGFEITDVGSWIRVVDSNHIVLRSNTLVRATIEGTRGSVKLLRSDDCSIVGNRIDDGNDNITIVDSARSHVTDNIITLGHHSLISVRCSDASVFRGNVLANSIQKAIEIYDCEGSSSDDPIVFDSTYRNLWEGNAFAGTAPSDQPHDYNAMQMAGQDGIVRRNIYFNNLGGGVNLQVYPDEALENHGNRIYHNTFVANLCHALAASAGPAAGYYDNKITANLLYANADCAGAGEQIQPGDPIAAQFADNTLATRDPGFVDAAAADFQLMMGSPVIDTGPWLARTAGAGRGTMLAVDDARWFWDGGGIAEEEGDLIQLEGDANTARVLAVDVAAGVLTLDSPLTWSDGQGLALAYAGAAPDPGAYEHGAMDPDTDTDGSSSSGDDTTTGVTTTGNNDTGAPTTSASGDPTAGATGTPSTQTGTSSEGSASTSGGQSEGNGCACSSDGDPRAGAWMLLVLAALGRRRRGDS